MTKITELKEPANTCDRSGCKRTALYSVRKPNYMLFVCSKHAREERAMGQEVKAIFRKFPGSN